MQWSITYHLKEWPSGSYHPVRDGVDMITFHLEGGSIEVLHKGDYLEVRQVTRGGSLARLTIEPQSSDEIRLRLEPPATGPA